MDDDAVIDALRPFALALKLARERLGAHPDINDVTAIAARYITYDDLKNALSVYAQITPTPQATPAQIGDE